MIYAIEEEEKKNNARIFNTGVTIEPVDPMLIRGTLMEHRIIGSMPYNIGVANLSRTWCST